MIQGGMRPDQLRSSREHPQKSRPASASASKPSSSRNNSQSRSAQAETSMSRDGRSVSPETMDVDKHATSIYQAAMDGIRGTTFRRRQEKRKRAPSPLSSTANVDNALIPGEEFVGDDWLIDDMLAVSDGPHVSRDAAKILYTSGQRAPAEKRKPSSFLGGSKKPSPAKSRAPSSSTKRRSGETVIYYTSCDICVF